MESFAARVEIATRSRDRVVDLAKVVALLVVIVGHSFAWQVHDGRACNVLEVCPELIWLTWFVQILPIFFAMGAQANEHCMDGAWAHARALGRGRAWANREYWHRRLTRLLGPVLIYTTAWTGLLGLVGMFEAGSAHDAGQFLAQLLWFVGVYMVVGAAVPVTLELHRKHRLATLTVWFTAIVAVDLGRANGLTTLGWINLFLVWGWLHQWGYAFGSLRVAPRTATFLAAVMLLVTAAALVSFGPYSNSLVSIAGDKGLANLAPPSVVLAVAGLAMILLLAAADRWLARVIGNDRLWAVVATLGSRGMGLYLWHIPIVGLIAALSLARDVELIPLSGTWFLVHTVTAIVAVIGAFVLAGVAGAAQVGLARGRFGDRGGAVATILAALLVLHISVTGLYTYWGPGALGLPGSSALNLAALWLVWLGRGRSSSGGNLELGPGPAPTPCPRG